MRLGPWHTGTPRISSPDPSEASGVYGGRRPAACGELRAGARPGRGGTRGAEDPSGVLRDAQERLAEHLRLGDLGGEAAGDGEHGAEGHGLGASAPLERGKNDVLEVCVLDVSGSMSSNHKLEDLQLSAIQRSFFEFRSSKTLK